MHLRGRLPGPLPSVRPTSAGSAGREAGIQKGLLSVQWFRTSDCLGQHEGCILQEVSDDQETETIIAAMLEKAIIQHMLQQDPLCELPQVCRAVWTVCCAHSTMTGAGMHSALFDTRQPTWLLYQV